MFKPNLQNSKRKVLVRRAKKCIKNIEMIYEPQEKDIELFGGYSTIVPEAKYKVIHGQGIKISNIRQMLQRLPIALAQVKAENTSENLLNEIR